MSIRYNLSYYIVSGAFVFFHAELEIIIFFMCQEGWDFSIGVELSLIYILCCFSNKRILIWFVSKYQLRRKTSLIWKTIELNQKYFEVVCLCNIIQLFLLSYFYSADKIVLSYKIIWKKIFNEKWKYRDLFW